MLAAAHRGATGIRGHHTKDVDSTASEQASAHVFRQPHGYVHRAVSLLHQPEIAFDQAYARLDRPESAVYPDAAARSRLSHSGRRRAPASVGSHDGANFCRLRPDPPRGKPPLFGVLSVTSGSTKRGAAFRAPVRSSSPKFGLGGQGGVRCQMAARLSLLAAMVASASGEGECALTGMPPREVRTRSG